MPLYDEAKICRCLNRIGGPTHVVIHRVSQFLFASKVVLSRLHGCMAKQKLNLFKLAPGQVTESCAGAP
jgi:hypothetical protein